MDVIETLRREFSYEFEIASALPFHKTAYHFTYVVPRNSSPANQVGMLLKALDIQRSQIENKLIQSRQNHLKVPTNPWFAQLGLKYIEIMLSSAYRRNHKDSEGTYADAASAAIEILDLRDIRFRFTGLPFFHLAIDRFSNPEFREEGVRLHKKLFETLDALTKGSDFVFQSLFEIAVEVCRGNRERAVELLGLHLSLDTTVVDYLDYFRTRDRKWAAVLGELPILVRLISLLDRLRHGTSSDRFSYDGVHRSQNIKNYYFWSGALLAQKLRSRGFSSSELVKRITVEVVRNYKRLRRINDHWVFNLGRKIHTIPAEELRRDGIESMKNLRSGARFALSAENCLASLSSLPAPFHYAKDLGEFAMHF